MSDQLNSASSSNEPEMKGFLLKWTNYLKGYQRRWFVLSNGVLSYFRAEHGFAAISSGGGNRSGGVKLSIRRRRKGPRQDNQAEMAHTCRGTISLHGALIHTVDSCTFVISNGGTQTFHIKAANEVERQSWVTALELAKAKAIRAIESEEDDEDTNAQAIPSEELNGVIRDLASRLENLKTCYDLISKHGTALQRSLSELETSDDIPNKSKVVSERATLFRISSNAMINACTDYLGTAQNQGHKWSKMLLHERDQRQHLEEMVEQLARQHSHLEAAAKSHNRPNTTTSATSEDDDEIEFYDAQEGAGTSGSQEESSFIIKIPVTRKNSTKHLNDDDNNDDDATGSSSDGEEATSETHQVLVVAEQSNQSVQRASMDVADSITNFIVDLNITNISKISSLKALKERRTRVPDKPNYPLNLWSVMKNCIGKDLSKIPMPVNFNEPLSMLQRLAEDHEYSELLDQAATCKDPCEQLAYVAAFTISSYSTTSIRTGKPFNPLLGETYECDRTDDLGWRLMSEQVSHHPPMAAMYAEGRGWKCWQEFAMTTKFRGKYLQVIPLGCSHLEFDDGNKYTWRKVTTTIHNIIVGKLWVDNHGDMEIIGANNAKGIKCHLKYIPYSYFTRESQRRVKGVIMNTASQVKWSLNGTWDNKIEIAPVISTAGSPVSPVYTTGTYKTIWTRRMPPDDCDKYYNFTMLACQLNEIEEGVAPTDSRCRPDQRLMENGAWDESNIKKLQLEEKQRSKRRQKEASAEKAASNGRPYPPYEPVWFKQERINDSDCFVYSFNGDYWDCKNKQDWSRCTEIF